MRALVVGKDGRIGKELFNVLQELGCETVGTTRKRYNRAYNEHYLDLMDQGFQLPEADIGFMVAAFCSLAECEEDRMGTHQLNVDAPIRIVRRMKEMGIFPVYFSSEAATWGTGIYGQQKGMADLAMQTLGGVAILRIKKVFPGCFEKVARKAAEIGLERKEGVFIL